MSVVSDGVMIGVVILTERVLIPVPRDVASALSDVSGLRVELLWRVSWFLSGLGTSDCWGCYSLGAWFWSWHRVFLSGVV